MAGSTPNLGLYLPGGGSTGTWTPDEVADVDPINQNFQKIDTFAGTVGVQANRNQQYVGPAAAISSVVGMKIGDEYQESDGNLILWRYNGTAWKGWSSNWIAYTATYSNIVLGTGGTMVNRYRYVQGQIQVYFLVIIQVNGNIIPGERISLPFPAKTADFQYQEFAGFIQYRRGNTAWSGKGIYFDPNTLQWSVGGSGTTPNTDPSATNPWGTQLISNDTIFGLLSYDPA